MIKLLTQKKVLEMLNITRPTLLKWEEKGLINPVILDSGHRRYKSNEIKNILGLNDLREGKTCVIYSRVSTKKQKESGNLKRQTERLNEIAIQNGYQVLEIYEEVASGINENRRSLNRMLRKVSSSDVDFLLIEYKDRLARFGYNYIEKYCKSHKTNILVVEEVDKKTLNEEMVEDMISIITSFSARLYGQRGARKVRYEIDKLNKKEG